MSNLERGLWFAFLIAGVGLWFYVTGLKAGFKEIREATVGTVCICLVLLGIVLLIWRVGMAFWFWG